MSIRVHSNIALPPTRWLPKIYDATGLVPGTAVACGLVNPNTLPGGPKITDAMGLSTEAGLISLFHDQATSTNLTVFYWSALANRFSASAGGWIHLGNSASIYTQQVDQFSLATFAVPEKCAIFIMATTNPIVNMALGGCFKHAAQAVPDIPYIT